MVSQFYVTEAENEYVIRGNAAIVRCKIPSFVSDFVYVESWIMDDGQILTINNTNDADGNDQLLFFNLHIQSRIHPFRFLIP